MQLHWKRYCSSALWAGVLAGDCGQAGGATVEGVLARLEPARVGPGLLSHLPSPFRAETGATGLAVLGVAGLLALAWVIWLRRRVQHQTEVIRDQLRVEQALRQQYHDLFQEASDIIITLDLEGRFTSINRAAERLTGYSCSEAGQMRLVEVLASECHQTSAARLRQVRETGTCSPAELVAIAKDGRRLTLEVNTRLVVKEGRPVGYQTIARDVTERKRAEAQLRKLSQAVDQSPTSIVITDARGIIEYVNPKFCEVTGYTPAEVIGQRPGVLKSGHTPPHEYEQLWNTILAGHVWRGEFRNRKKSGALFWESASIYPVTDAGGQITHYIGIKEDITERKSLESQLQQAQKMESIGRLAAGVAHDYNNLLTVIQGHLGLLLNESGLLPAHTESLEEIAAATERATNLTRQLLAFSRRQVMQVKPLDVNEVVTNLAKMLNRLLGEDITLQVRFCPKLPTVLGDVGMLEQVLMNLVVNARDAMPKGGELTIETQSVVIDAGYVARRPEAQPGLHVGLSVIDTGCGMSREILDRVFEPFFTTKETGKGTGLGLATVFGIVKQHRGWIEVDSHVGQGSNFRVFLPAQPQTVRAKKHRAKGEYSKGGHETILVVEDEVAIRQLTCRLLERGGYEVLQAADGREAMQAWQRANGAVDLLLTDMVMPGGMTGSELAEALQRERPGLGVVFASGYSTMEVNSAASADPGAAMLTKPFDPAALLRTVRKTLDRASHGARDGRPVKPPIPSGGAPATRGERAPQPGPAVSTTP